MDHHGAKDHILHGEPRVNSNVVGLGLVLLVFCGVITHLGPRICYDLVFVPMMSTSRSTVETSVDVNTTAVLRQGAIFLAARIQAVKTIAHNLVLVLCGQR